jgi:hypothetical protein
MKKALLPVVLTILTGCAAQQAEQATPSTSLTFADAGAVGADAQLLAAAAAPAAQLDVTDFTSTTVCRKVTNTGSRMVRGEVCTSRDNLTWQQREYEDKKLRWDIDDVNRLQNERMRRYQQDMDRFVRGAQGTGR